MVDELYRATILSGMNVVVIQCVAMSFDVMAPYGMGNTLPSATGLVLVTLVYLLLLAALLVVSIRLHYECCRLMVRTSSLSLLMHIAPNLQHAPNV